MRCYDFEYDGFLLSDYGYIICSFDSADMETVAGAEITFNTVATQFGAKYELTSSTYETCLETTFQICKNPCSDEHLYISVPEYRRLTRWLNRKTFHKLKLFGEDGSGANIYYEASFNLSSLEMGERIVGIELAVKTNRPYALHEPKIITIENTDSGGTATIIDSSDDEGYIYPYTTITITSGGDLAIYNALEDRTTSLANCSAGEVLTFNYPLISSSDSSHEIQNDFNWTFFRIANTFRNKKNELTISIPCTIELEYSPVVKLGL